MLEDEQDLFRIGERMVEIDLGVRFVPKRDLTPASASRPAETRRR
jgi:hypothetical protein